MINVMIKRVNHGGLTSGNGGSGFNFKYDLR